VDQIPFIFQVGVVFAIVAAPIVLSIIIMNREASIESPIPLLFNDPEPKRGIAEGDLDPWRLDLVRPRPSSTTRSAPQDRTHRQTVGGCELAAVR
jgi:hypothetical protein